MRVGYDPPPPPSRRQPAINLALPLCTTIMTDKQIHVALFHHKTESNTPPSTCQLHSTLSTFLFHSTVQKWHLLEKKAGEKNISQSDWLLRRKLVLELYMFNRGCPGHQRQPSQVSCTLTLFTGVHHAGPVKKEISQNVTGFFSDFLTWCTSPLWLKLLSWVIIFQLLMTWKKFLTGWGIQVAT